MIESRRSGIRLVDYYFGEPTSPVQVDIVRYHLWEYPVLGCDCYEFYTIVLDLTQSEGSLFGAIKQGTRYEIRRAQSSDHLTYRCWENPKPDIVQSFCDFYNGFAAEKDLPKAPRTRLQHLSRSAGLAISSVSNAHETLVWHAYLKTPARVRLDHSASPFRSTEDVARRQLIGRANRFHHWQDILLFRGLSIATMDLGGWYAGTEHKKLLQINKFKEEFGGHVIRGFNCTTGVTWRGKLALRIRGGLHH